ncbi:hypothetical protein [Heyndrickxia coagulans]|uniref:hypothetical protein n=1 Tax=Heyndrickxia coagulans TaxID=1398 RepID=UPI0015C680D1|nr:hypothetical protein [Heyndrickxia coagulans]
MKYPLVRKHLMMVPFGKKLSIGTIPNGAIEIEDPDRAIDSVLSIYDGKRTVEVIHRLNVMDNIKKLI